MQEDCLLEQPGANLLQGFLNPSINRSFNPLLFRRRSPVSLLKIPAPIPAAGLHLGIGDQGEPHFVVPDEARYPGKRLIHPSDPFLAALCPPLYAGIDRAVAVAGVHPAGLVGIDEFESDQLGFSSSQTSRTFDWTRRYSRGFTCTGTSQDIDC